MSNTSLLVSGSSLRPALRLARVAALPGPAEARIAACRLTSVLDPVLVT